jgi:hypothetical protein
MRSAAGKAPAAFARNSGLMDQVDYRLAETEAEKDAIYRLRYRAYRHEGAIEPRGDQRLIDRFDYSSNSWIFGVYLYGDLISSLRISVATPDNDDTPAVDAFRDLLEPELASGKVIVDPNRFVADPLRRSEYPELPYMTLRLAYVACTHFKADIGTATVRKEHQSFYRRVFLHKLLCPPRPYPTLIKTLCLMAVDYPKMCETVYQRYPFFRSTAFERRMLFDREAHRSSAESNSPAFPFGGATIAPR